MGATSAGLSVAAAVAAFGVQSAGKNLAVAEEKTNKMAYRMLGNSGLQVSVLAYGFWATFGDKNDLKGDSGVDMAKKCLRAARKGGVNLFDNAEGYGSGRAERIMGEAIRQLREEVVLHYTDDLFRDCLATIIYQHYLLLIDIILF